MNYFDKMNCIVCHGDPDLLLPRGYNGVALFADDLKLVHYYSNGKLHRIDGPAITREELNYFYLNGKRFYSLEEWFEALSEEEKEVAIFNMNEWIHLNPGRKY